MYLLGSKSNFFLFTPSSLVIRDLTFSSAASFGSFHLLRLLFDEYMFYLLEKKIAEVTGIMPIAIIGQVQVRVLEQLFKSIHIFTKLSDLKTVLIII